jgi:hypothetical protein
VDLAEAVEVIANAPAVEESKAGRAEEREQPAAPRAGALSAKTAQAERAHGADEARVRAIEAAADAWKRDRRDRDAATARRLAREYLARPDAAQKDRVRAALQRAGLEAKPD